MDFRPLPPPLPPPSPNPNPNPNTPTSSPTNFLTPKNTPLPFESIPKSSPDNSFKGQTPADQAEVHRRSIDEGAKDVKAPLEFRLEQPLNLNGAEVGAQDSSEVFNTAVVLVVATLECGYYPKGPHVHHGQARHACAVLAATSRSYTKHYELGIETTLEEARA